MWSYDLDRGTLSPVTQGGVSYEPLPDPDGMRVAYEATRDGTAGILMSRLDGSGEERLTTTKRAHAPTSWSPDGEVLAFTSTGENGRCRVELVTIQGDRTPRVLLEGPFDVGAARFSPDGRWLAHVSDESGRDQVYVRPYPLAGDRVAVSADGGTEPVWSSDSRELFFRNGDELLAVTVGAGPTPTVGRPRVLFSRFNPPSGSGSFYDLDADYDVSPDGTWFAMPGWTAQEEEPRVHLVLGWFEELRRLSR